MSESKRINPINDSCESATSIFNKKSEETQTSNIRFTVFRNNLKYEEMDKTEKLNEKQRVENTPIEVLLRNVDSIDDFEELIEKMTIIGISHQTIEHFKWRVYCNIGHIFEDSNKDKEFYAQARQDQRERDEDLIFEYKSNLLMYTIVYLTIVLFATIVIVVIIPEILGILGVNPLCILNVC